MARKKPIPKSERKLTGRDINRSQNVRGRSANKIKSDDIKNVTIGLMDVDSTIMYYFNEVIKPTVLENGEVVKVPILYANAERWKSIQKDEKFDEDGEAESKDEAYWKKLNKRLDKVIKKMKI